MQFAAPGFLAWGWLLAAIPIAIHLLMRKKPAQLEFPTLRFLRAAQKKQSRRLRFQHLLLLLLRVALVLLVLLAFSRPQIRQRRDALAFEEPVDALLLVDTSLSMQAVAGGGTLLQRARVWGRGLLEALPRGSRVALVTAHPGPLEWSARAQQLDRRLAALELREDVVSLGPAIVRARTLLSRMAERRTAFYILTDLTRVALPRGALEGWPEQIPATLVDLAGGALDNAYLDKLQVAPQAVLPGTPVEVRGVAAGHGRAGRMTLDLVVAGRTLQTQAIELPDGGRVPFRFSFAARTPGALQGRVQIREQDALPRDNALYFTVRVFRSLPVLVVGGPRFSAGASWKWLRLALDPEERGKRLAADLASPAQLAGRLAGCSVLILPDVAGLSDESWAALEEFVAAGGGLLVLLGPGIELAEWRGKQARELLGLEVVGPERLARPASLRDVRWKHPLLSPFKGGANGDLPGVEWRSLVRLQPGAQAVTLARLGPLGLPALVERPLGRGRVLVLAGGIDPRWSDLVRSYAFVPLVQESLKHLARLRAGGQQRNFRAGETAALDFPRGERPVRLRLVGPGGAARVVAAGAEPKLQLPLDDGPGHYSYLFEGRRSVLEEGGLSANFPTEESDLTRLVPKQAPEHLGLDKLVVLEGGGASGSELQAGSRTRELTPLIALLLLVLLTVESYVSTLRYK